MHAAIKIRKEGVGDPKKALEAAFRGHQSLKHAVVVDEDIDVGDPERVEWAIATRAQMDQDLTLFSNQFGSSLDPSADQVSRRTCKAGLDATIPLGASRATFARAKIPGADGLNVDDYL